jgi:hypothetical protein
VKTPVTSSSRTDDRQSWPIVLASVLSAALSVGVSFTLATRTADKLRDAQCTMIVAADDNYRAAPPTSDLGKSQARSYAALRVSQGCPPAVK